MRYPLVLKGFEGQTLEVQPAGILSGPQLLVNGQPAAKGPRRGLMLLRRNDGRQVVAAWRAQIFGLDVPQLLLDGQRVNIVEPLRWYVWAWSALPILLVLIGGALGALAGFIGFGINTKIFRTSLPGPAKFGLTVLVSLLAVGVYLVAATLLYVALGRPV
jgi:hypothetical protein